MVVFGNAVSDIVMLVTDVNGGVMLAYDDIVMLVIGGDMVVSGFVITDVAMLVMDEVMSPYCHVGTSRKWAYYPGWEGLKSHSLVLVVLQTGTKDPSRGQWVAGAHRGGGPLVPVYNTNRD
jgi:hypothetical protein